MRCITNAIVIAALLGSGGCGRKTPNSGMADPAGPHFATLCVNPNQWPELIERMKLFASAHGMEFHGGVGHDPIDGKRQLNAYLAQDYNYYFGDGFDIWFISNPFDPREIDVNGIVKQKSITSEQTSLARALLAQTRDLARLAGRSAGQRKCSEASMPPNVR